MEPRYLPRGTSRERRRKIVIDAIVLVDQEIKIDKKVAIRRVKGVSTFDPRHPKITLNSLIIIIWIINLILTLLKTCLSKAWSVTNELDSVGGNLTKILLFNFFQIYWCG